MEKVNVYVEAEVNPTEEEVKVKKAVENIFANMPLQTRIQPEHARGLLSAENNEREALTKLYNLLRRERIRDAARKVFFEGLSGDTISFNLNKQAAYAGHVSFCQEVAESPLGPIKVRIKSENPRELIRWLTSKEDQRPFNEQR
jgi:predicted RNA binding protein with dsRBD fold (UPF0201 family)